MKVLGSCDHQSSCRFPMITSRSTNVMVIIILVVLVQLLSLQQQVECCRPLTITNINHDHMKIKNYSSSSATTTTTTTTTTTSVNYNKLGGGHGNYDLLGAGGRAQRSMSTVVMPPMIGTGRRSAYEGPSRRGAGH